ncbi:unnamed protein product [Strongylus vulgaris]|uniref:Nucleolar protein 16 n=1 Tax=Strongylus vulgaris TaxID=40348 RepID=A0A3P7J8L1_STRVU|nr:unnamed protein product [Strongylus vulgaris]
MMDVLQFFLCNENSRAHTLVYSPDVAEKRQLFTHSASPIIREVSEDERARRAEKKKEKKEERKRKREEEQKRQEELEYQKWQEMQKKKEEELMKAEAERRAAERKAAEERKKEAAQAAQTVGIYCSVDVLEEAKKEKAKKEKKQDEIEKVVTNTTVKVEKTTPNEAPTVPEPKLSEETEKKKKKKEKEPVVEKKEKESSVDKEKVPRAEKKQKESSAVKKEEKATVEKKEEKPKVEKKEKEHSSEKKQKDSGIEKREEKHTVEKKEEKSDAEKKKKEQNVEKRPKESSIELKEEKSSAEMETNVGEKGREPVTEKETAPVKKEQSATETAPILLEGAQGQEVHTKKKGSRGKKNFESESSDLHNGHEEKSLSSDLQADGERRQHADEPREVHPKESKKGKKNKKNESQAADVANGHVVNAAADDSGHVVDSAPITDAANGGVMHFDGEKKKSKEKKQETAALLDSSEINQTTDVVLDKDESSTKKNKQKEKKAKQLSPGIEVITEVTVVTETTKSDKETPVDQSSPPIQVHEVTSTANENGMKETVHTITATINTTSSTSPTQFAQNVEKLVSHTLKKAKHDIVDIDPSVKMTIDAQLVKLSERKPEVATEHKIHITPLPLELHYSRPTTPSSRERVYKLLPRDILFCSSLIDAHGEDYAAMAADPKNIYKENARAIQRKVRIFKVTLIFDCYRLSILRNLLTTRRTSAPKKKAEQSKKSWQKRDKRNSTETPIRIPPAPVV